MTDQLAQPMLDLGDFSQLIETLPVEKSGMAFRAALGLGDAYALAVVQRICHQQLYAGDLENLASLMATGLVEECMERGSWGLLGDVRDILAGKRDPDDAYPKLLELLDGDFWELMLEAEINAADLVGLETAASNPPVVSSERAGDIGSGALFSWLHKHHPQELSKALADCTNSSPLQTLCSAAEAGPECLGLAISLLRIDPSKKSGRKLVDNFVANILIDRAGEGKAEALAGLETLIATTGVVPWMFLPKHLDVLLGSEAICRVIRDGFVGNEVGVSKMIEKGGIRTVLSLHEAGFDMRGWRDPNTGFNLAHLVAGHLSCANLKGFLFIAGHYPDLLSIPDLSGVCPAEDKRVGLDKEVRVSLWGQAHALHVRSQLDQGTASAVSTHRAAPRI